MTTPQMTSEKRPASSSGFDPNPAELHRRRRRGALWRAVFFGSTLIGILALLLLLYNVIDGAFGYVAVQNAIDPDTIELEIEERRMLAAANLVESEDDTVLVEGVAANPYAIGFFGHAYYVQNSDRLRAIAVDDALPTAENVAEGDYPIARPLYLYTTANILREKPEVAAYIEFVNDNINTHIEGVGYFPVRAQVQEHNALLMAETLDSPRERARAEARSEAHEEQQSPVHNASAEFEIVGSSTIYPLNQRLIEEFIATGYAGVVENDFAGTKAGFAAFCSRNGPEVVASSREIWRAELNECTRVRRTPLGFHVGNDAVAVTVSAENTFLQNATHEELRAIFTDAMFWSDVNADWPHEPIQRYVPGRDSGTLDTFVGTVFDQELHELPKATLIAILEENISAGLMRRLEHDQPFAERSQSNVYDLVVERVVDPDVVRSWSLTDSLLRRAAIEETIAQIPDATMEFRSWITWNFITSAQSSRPEFSGIRVAILGSLWVIFITIAFSLPVGVGAAIYLEEYAAKNWFNNLIETNIANLAGVPSIIYGMLGLAIFVRVLEPLTSGTLFGLTDPTTANGRTVISAGLTLGLLILPIIIINAREAVRAVPASIRQAAYGLGATRWQTIWSHVLPSAIPGILTGNILAMSRAIGETAPLVVVGASTFIIFDPEGPFAKFTTLPILIYQWTSRPQPEFRNLAAAAIIVLLLLLLTLNAAAVLLRNQYSRQRT